jgi:hypothetical protein
MGNFITHCIKKGGILRLYHITLHGLEGADPSAVMCSQSTGAWIADKIGQFESLIVGAVAWLLAALIIVVAITATLLSAAGMWFLLCRCLCCCCPRVREYATTAPMVAPYNKGIMPESLRWRKRRNKGSDEENDDDTHEHDE